MDETTRTGAVKPCPILGKSITNQSVPLAQICDKIIAMREIIVCELLCSFVILPSIIFQSFFFLGFFSLCSIDDSFPFELPKLACQLLASLE